MGGDNSITAAGDYWITADTGKPERVAARDPVAQGQREELAAIDAATRTGVQILDGGLGVLELRPLQQTGAFALVAQVALAIDQQGQAFLEAQGLDLGLRGLLFQCGCEAEQLQGPQLGEGGVIHHGRLLVHW